MYFLQNLEDRIGSIADVEEKTKCQVILEHANVSSVS